MNYKSPRPIFFHFCQLFQLNKFHLNRRDIHDDKQLHLNLLYRHFVKVVYQEFHDKQLHLLMNKHFLEIYNILKEKDNNHFLWLFHEQFGLIHQ